MPATGISRGGSRWETLQLDSVGIAISGLEKTWPDPHELHENILFWIVLKITTFLFPPKNQEWRLAWSPRGGAACISFAHFFRYRLAAPRKRMDLAQSHLQKDSL